MLASLILLLPAGVSVSPRALLHDYLEPGRLQETVAAQEPAKPSAPAAYDRADLPDLSGSWNTTIGPLAVNYRIWQSGPYFLWSADALGESAHGEIVVLPDAGGIRVDATWTNVFTTDRGQGQLERDASGGRVIRWSHGVVFVEDSGVEPLGGSIPSALPDLSGAWDAKFGPLELRYQMTQAGRYYLWSNDALRENGVGELTPNPDGSFSLTARWTGKLAGDGKGIGTASLSDGALGPIRWDTGITFYRPGAPPAATGAGGGSTAAGPSDAKAPPKKEPGGPVVTTSPDGGFSKRNEGGAVKAPAVGEPDRTPLLYVGQVLSLRNSRYSVEPALPKPAASSAAYWLVDIGDGELVGSPRWNWFEFVPPESGLATGFERDLSLLPSGVVFSLRDATPIKTYVIFGGDPVYYSELEAGNVINVPFRFGRNELLVKPNVRQTQFDQYRSEVEVFFVRPAGSKVQWIGWFETKGPTRGKEIERTARLAPGTVVGLKHTIRQPDKVLLWDKIYDPAKPGPAPEGFRRMFGGDSVIEELPENFFPRIEGQPHGFYWYEKIATP